MGDRRRVAVRGPETLGAALAAQGAEVLRVSPRGAPLDPALLGTLLVAYADDRIDAANRGVGGHLAACRPVVTGVAPAGAVLRRPEERWLVLGGPPPRPDALPRAQRAAACGAAVLEGWAGAHEEAAAMIAAGEIELLCGDDVAAAAPGAAAIGPSTPCWVVRDASAGAGSDALAPLLVSGPAALWRGDASEAALGREREMRAGVAPAVAAALRGGPPVDVLALCGEALEMGDDGHGRTRALTLLLVRELLPALAERAPAAVTGFLAAAGRGGALGLGVACAAGRAALEGIVGAEASSVVTGIAGDGHGGVAVRLAGAPGRWFHGRSAPPVDGRGRALAHVGDSWLAELPGLGAGTGIAVRGMGAGGGPEGPGEARERAAARAACAVAATAPGVPGPHGGLPVGLDARACCDLGLPPVLAAPALGGDAGEDPVVRPLHVPVEALAAALTALLYALEEDPSPTT